MNGFSQVIVTQTWVPSASGTLGGLRAQQKNSDSCQLFCLEESCLSSPHPEARPLSFSLCVSVTFRAAVPALQFRVSESVSKGVGPLKGTPGTPAILWFMHPQSLLVFTVRSYGDFSPQRPQHWHPGLGSLLWGWGPLFRGEPPLPRYSPYF